MCALLCASGFARATTYYVSTAGNDSNPGTQASPFRHVSRGAGAAHAGDTVMVMNGTYDNEGQIANLNSVGAVVTVTNTGSAGAPITIQAQNRGQAILDASSTVQSSLGCYGAWSYFDLSYTAYVVIQGFIIQNACVNGVRANGNAHDITLRWNEIRDIGNWNNPATTLSPSGMYLNSGEYNFTIDGNSFHDIGGGTNVNQQHAIYNSASNVTITNNLFYNQFHGWDIQAAASKNLYIVNNTFAFANPNRAGHIILWDEGVTGGLQNIVIENNIFYQPQSYAVVAELDGGGSIGGCNMQNNLTTVASLFDSGATFGNGGVSCSQTATLTNSSPNFINASSAPYNFALQSGSPAVDTGTNNSYTPIDFAGGSRPVNNIYDRGAYEYRPSASPSGGTVQLSANPGSVSLVQGGSANVSVSVTISGSANPQFSVSGVPSGVTASISSSSCSSSCSPVLQLGAGSSYQGATTLLIAATNGSSTVTTPVALTVVPASNPAGNYTSGLMGEWKLLGNTVDSVASINGTQHGSVQWASTVISAVPLKSLMLNGTNAYISIPEASWLDTVNQMSVAFWAYYVPSPVGNTDERLVDKLYDWYVKLNGTHPQFTAGSNYALTNFSIPSKVWTHIAFTYNNGAVTAYVNGQPAGFAANTFPSGFALPNYTYGIDLGTDGTAAGTFAGMMNDVRIYNRPLSAADVAALYSAGGGAIQ